MTPTRWRRIEDVFTEAADLDPADRPAFLDRACRTPDGAPDPGLREEVERLLALDDGAEAFADGLRDRVGAAPEARPDAGPWRLVERVGEGGMGEVWRAERADGAYRQTAAVKLVRPGLAPELLARFRAERHVLARLAHPAIARLLDGGTASDGRPYLALEYVDGEPITAYADRRRLSVNERLALFADVCEAVAAAHRQLVVHRDLKPSNVLVADGPDGPRVKLLDFGIARLLDADAGFTVPVTAPDRRVMTPEYAAPEQVRGEPATTATDVYGLGVLLYELLTGARPYRPESRARRAVEEAILHAQPTEPSTAVTDAADAAHARATEPGKLRRRLRGDLDRIVLKALRKEPGRRYDGPAALAADVGRHLAGLPVEARPESAGYRAGKFVRRHRVGVAAAAAVLLAVVGGAGAALWQAAEADRQRAAAQGEAARAEGALAFVVGMFEDAAPEARAGAPLSVDTLLAQGVARAAGLAAQPLAEAPVLDALGQIAFGLGHYGRADSLHRRALRLRAAHLGPAHPDAATSELRLADVRFGLRDFDEADRLYARAHAARAASLAPDDGRVLEALNRLAFARYNRADPDAADSLYRRVLAHTRAPDRARDPERAAALAGLGDVRLYQDRPADAERLYRAALAHHRAVDGDVHPATADARSRLARALQAQGRFRDAARQVDAAGAVLRRVYGEPHESVAQADHERARLLDEAGDAAAAEAAYRAAAAGYVRSLGTAHAYAAYPLNDLGVLLVDGGRPAEAERVLRRALAVYRASGEDEGGGLVAGTSRHLGRALAAQGRRAEADRALRRSLAAFEALGDSEGVALVRSTLATL